MTDLIFPLPRGGGLEAVYIQFRLDILEAEYPLDPMLRALSTLYAYLHCQKMHCGEFKKRWRDTARVVSQLRL